MRKHPLIIALTAVGIIAGTGVGIAAISSETASDAALNAAAQVEAQPAVTAAQTAVEAPAPTETTTAVEASTSVALTPVAQAPVDSVVLKSAAAPQPVATRARTDEYYVRLPFTSRQVKVSNPTFPSYSSDVAEPPPSLIAFLDRKAANTQLAGARGSVFPSSGDRDAEVSQATIAYFDQLEMRRQAAIKAAAPAVAVAPAAPAPVMDTAASAVSQPAQQTVVSTSAATTAPQ